MRFVVSVVVVSTPFVDLRLRSCLASRRQFNCFYAELVSQMQGRSKTTGLNRSP